jgi:hypothetical protein
MEGISMPISISAKFSCVKFSQLDSDVIKILISYGTRLHAGKNNIQHLRQCSPGSGLIDQILAGQINVVTRPHSQKNGGFVNLDMLARYYSQKCLKIDKSSK